MPRSSAPAVQNIHELFSAVETLSHMHPLRGERLMIVSNGVAPAAMALDELLSHNGKLAILGEESLAQLGSALPEFIRTDNPLDLRDDATPQGYLVAIKALLDSHDYDTLLLIHEANALRYSPTGAVNTLHSKHGGYLPKQVFQPTAHQKGQ